MVVISGRRKREKVGRKRARNERTGQDRTRRAWMGWVARKRSSRKWGGFEGMGRQRSKNSNRE